MITEKFIKNGIHYIREIFDSGTINIYIDPEFQDPVPELNKPPLPPLDSIVQKLDFVIDRLHLKDGFS